MIHWQHLQILAVLLVLTTRIASASDEETLNRGGVEKNTETSHSVSFLTLRNHTGLKKPSKFFGGDRDIMRTGVCHVTHKHLTALKPIADKAPFYIPEEIVKLDTIQLFQEEQFWRQMDTNLNGQAPLLFVHGFFISFERGCKRASLLQDAMNLSGRLILFSWPSDGNIMNYTRDEADIYWSVEPIHRSMHDMIERYGVGTVNIAAHSLGTRAVMYALARLAHNNDTVTPPLNQVILIAPDIDAEIFKQHLPLIKPMARKITLYVSNKDNPLSISRQVHGYPRLGEAGSHLEDLAGIEIIDLSDVSLSSPSGHVYHLRHDQVINDLSQLINDNLPASKRRNLKKTKKYQWRLQPDR